MAKHISLIQRNPDIRNKILGKIAKEALTYSDLEATLKAANIPIDRSQLSRYLNNKVDQGSIMPEVAILALCEHLKIKVKLLIQ